MANYRSWMLTGYQQNDTNGRHGLQWMHTRGLNNHRYGNSWNNVDLSNWRVVDQSYDSPLDNSTGRFYCRSKGVRCRRGSGLGRGNNKAVRNIGMSWLVRRNYE